MSAIGWSGDFRDFSTKKVVVVVVVIEPRSPYLRGGWLVQESLPTAWHILVSAILLNQSRRTVAWDSVLHELFGRWPDARALGDSDSSLEELLRPFGFMNVKAKRLRGMSLGYLEWDGEDPRVLYGCGQYAYDSWRIFVRGDRPDVVNDGPLSLYLARWHSGWREGDGIPERFRIPDKRSLS